MNVEVGLDDLAGERPEAAPFVVGALVADIEVSPLPKPIKVLEPVELLAAMEPEDALSLPLDHRQHEALFGREVVVDLRPADARGAPELVVVRGVDALGVDQRGGVLEDPGTRGLPLLGEPARLWRRRGLHDAHRIKNGLDSPILMVLYPWSGLRSPKSDPGRLPATPMNRSRFPCHA